MPDLTFSDAFRFVLSAEGGFANDPTDKGGPTNFGITQTTYDTFLARHGLASRSVCDLTTDDAQTVYLEMFWQDGGCDELPSPLNAVHFDSRVNHGPNTAHAMLTWAQFAPDQPPEREAFALLVLRYSLYNRIVAKDPTQGRFLIGWKNRLDSLRKFIGL